MVSRKPAPGPPARAKRGSKTKAPKQQPGNAADERALVRTSRAAGVSETSEKDSEKDAENDTESDAPELLLGEVIPHDRGQDDNLFPPDEEEDEEALLAEDSVEDGAGRKAARPSALAPVRDPLQRFLTEARSYRRLTEREERELVEAARGQGDIGAARRLVVHNLRLVVTIAYQYRRAWTNILDLFQEGSVGLMEAVRRWDPELGTRFGTYAAYWIRAYILKFLMTNARLIHVGNTRAGRKLFFRLEKERARLRAAGYEPTPKLLAANLDVDEKDVLEVSQHLASREVSFEPRPDDDGVSLAERISSPQQASPEQQAGRSMLADQVRTAMDAFAAGLEDEREQAVWALHLAAQDDPVPLSELGARYGVSKQRMGQIADRLKKRFRDALVLQMGPEIQMSWQPGQEE